MLAIIPARGGSKGLPGKNIANLGGKPMIAWTIEAARDATFVTRVIVSTDDREIARVARAHGAEVPFLRPAELATDTARAVDAFIYTVNRMEKQDRLRADAICVLQPTSPLRSSGDVDAAITLFHEQRADSVISVTESAHPITWTRRVGPEGHLLELPELEHDPTDNRQAYETTVQLNGAVVVFDYPFLQAGRSYYSEKTYAYVMPANRSVDVDTALDLAFCEFLVQRGGWR